MTYDFEVYTRVSVSVYVFRVGVSVCARVCVRVCGNHNNAYSGGVGWWAGGVGVVVVVVVVGGGGGGGGGGASMCVRELALKCGKGVNIL